MIECEMLTGFVCGPWWSLFLLLAVAVGIGLMTGYLGGRAQP